MDNQMDAPLLVVVLMVKNEADAMVNTLLPFVQGGVMHMCILDTGFTDATIEVTKTFFETHNVQGFIDEEPFVDFSTSRNRALEFAENHFPNATFFIMVDADWYIQNIQGLIAFCEEQKSGTEPLYFIKVELESLCYSSPRLFRVSEQIRYEGVVHELPERMAKITIDDAYFQHTITPRNDRRSKARYSKDAELLLASLAKNPTNPRTLFYLAQTYECLQDYKNAYKFYLKRSHVQAWAEEDVVTVYRLGCLAEYLSQVDDSISLHTAVDHFLEAFGMRPVRIEPLVRLANLYYKENPYLSFVYIRHACTVPFPKDDQLFVEKDKYDFVRYDILSTCAWYMGEYELGLEATEIALKVQPDNALLKQKQLLYQTQINTASINNGINNTHATTLTQLAHSIP